VRNVIDHEYVCPNLAIICVPPVVDVFASFAEPDHTGAAGIFYFSSLPGQHHLGLLAGHPEDEIVVGGRFGEGVLVGLRGKVSWSPRWRRKGRGPQRFAALEDAHRPVEARDAYGSGAGIFVQRGDALNSGQQRRLSSA